MRVVALVTRRHGRGQQQQYINHQKYGTMIEKVFQDNKKDLKVCVKIAGPSKEVPISKTLQRCLKMYKNKAVAYPKFLEEEKYSLA